jgi:hypothetical protein
MNIRVKPERIIFVLVCGILLLVLSNVVCYILKFVANHPRIHNFTMINLDEEANIPTYVSSCLLLASGCLLGVIALGEKKRDSAFFRHWIILSLLFFYMSLDEAAGIHEHLNGPINEWLDVGGVFYYGAVIPGIIALLFLLVAYFRFWMALPPRTKYLFLVSGVLYVGGVIGLEMVGGRHASLYGTKTLRYGLLATVEETLEFAGISLFLYALLDYLRTHTKTVCFEIGQDSP